MTFEKRQIEKAQNGTFVYLVSKFLVREKINLVSCFVASRDIIFELLDSQNKKI